MAAAAGPDQLDAPQPMREAGRELLSLALIEARNRTLALFAALEPRLDVPPQAQEPDDLLPPPAWLLGHVGWFQERWIARNLQRLRGATADPEGPRLASVESQADRWWDPACCPLAERGRLDLPPPAAVRAYLVDTLETTLELLAHCPESDDALYAFRLALFHEDRCGEQLAELAQWWGVKPPLPLEPQPAPPLAPIVLPAGRWRLGTPAGAGFVFDNEQGAHEQALPEHEIDAQPVSWAQFAEFVEDGGYDEPHWWSPSGWEWVDALGRRAPRAVEQMRSGVLLRRFGTLQQVPAAAPVLHVSWHEAQAWCRWAGRRLPTEAEWERAAVTAGPRGFRWGEVWEWTASRLRPYPGFSRCAGQLSEQDFGDALVLRGGSFATRARLRHPRLRGFAPPGRDAGFSGFRSCSL
ncbi:SUMF1/EgtB/PvdO family nonheme iron enzyme [Caldimonas tepidiphila]|uniref:SUMF1/EgtB/PvdO family nonheme iron enzyme n=1 Tax=Caldimonas tepidiphila TaxID=2315841 RepID=UPI001F0B733B|nr:SUMF1/EgtB/PvdO family nonheme iron enzyme [Caldimonas tepidiphila]